MNILLILLGLLPGFVWLIFYLQEDLRPEPKKLIAKTFLFGAIAVIPALGIEILLNGWMKILGIGQFTLVSLIVLSSVEEVTKFFAARFSVYKNANFDEPVDAMIYMVVAALGFATAENLGALTAPNEVRAAILSSVLTTTSLRFVGATLLHSLSSGIVGYFWARGIRKFGAKGPLIRGLLYATLLHALFNYFIMSVGGIIYSILLLVIVGFFVLGDFEKLKRENI
ncbi:MAG: Protease prsW [Parcubacteria group bacterium Gr01-1014_70]|nr:MAG: Protease prsW [Parcubacteria group bacterium Gr01-1014_70]